MRWIWLITHPRYWSEIRTSVHVLEYDCLGFHFKELKNTRHLKSDAQEKTGNIQSVVDAAKSML